jgi:hypothetical protein
MSASGLRAASAHNGQRYERWRIMPNRSSSDAAHVNNPAIVRVQRNLEAISAAPSMIDEKPPAAIDAPNVPKPSVPQEPFTLATGDSPAAVQAGADRDADARGLHGRRKGRRHEKGEGETETR